MKKFFLGVACLTLLLTNCESNEVQIDNGQQDVDMSDFYLQTEDSQNGSLTGRSANSNLTCATMQVLNRQLRENPDLYDKMYKVEYNVRKYLNSKKPSGAGNGNGNGGNGGGDGGSDYSDDLGVITIPIYVHVIYSNSNENISDQQIASQIAVLNNDFRRTNNDANQTPSEFESVATDAEIEFVLANTFRHSNSRTSWGTMNEVKSQYPPVTPSSHLNIWVCNIGGGILGYAQFPGGSLSTDGVVCSPQYFGTTGYVSAPFDKGRTMTHEVGHYLNLRHIWGDGRCKRDDFVSDTPSSDGPNYNCPTSAYNCRSNDQFMNYMDYTDDACMNMFTDGQKARMRSIFASGGARESILNP